MKSHLLLPSVLLLFLAAPHLQAAQPEPLEGGAPPGDTVAAAVQETGPVPIPEASEKAMRYYRSGNLLWLVSLAWGLLVPLLFLFTRLSAKIRDWARGIGRLWFFTIGIYFAIYSVISYVLDFPLSYYSGYARQHAYDLSNQTFGKWFGDSLKSLAIGIIIGFLFLWVPYLLLRLSPKRWWLYTGILIIPFVFLMLIVAPIWIAPLFNEFGPMKDKALEAEILALADRAGIEGGRVYEVEMSDDTETINAYVTGFGGTKRIVLWDTILEKLDREEVLVVMGHEMGHYVLGHTWKAPFIISILVLVTLYAAHRTSGWFLRRFKERIGFDRLSDIASLPLVLLLVGLFSFLITPLANTYTRYIEHQSDIFGVEITHLNRPAAEAFVKMTEMNLANPRPGLLYKLWRASHPPIAERMEFFNTYRPWEEGRPLKYEKYFRGPVPSE